MQTQIYQTPLLPDFSDNFQETTSNEQTHAHRPRRGADTRPRFVRAEPAQVHGDVTARDIAICEALYSYRLMTSDQVRALLLPHTTNANQTRRRLSFLFHAGYIDRKEMLIAQGKGSYKKIVLYFLEKPGLELLADTWHASPHTLDWSKNERTLGPYHIPHRLLCHDIRIVVTHAAQAHGLRIPIWKDEKTLKREHHTDPIVIPNPDGTTKRSWVEPDGYFVLEGQTPTGYIKRHRFLEIDGATESGTAQSAQKRAWNSKILAYLSYYRAGKFQARYHVKGMTVLTITSGGEGRLATLKAATEAAGGRERFLFTTLERLHNKDILSDPVWSVATKPTDERRSIIDKTVYRGPAGPSGPPLAQ